MITRLLLGLVCSGAIAVFSYRRGSLSGSGAIAAVLVGTGIFAGGGWPWFAMLFTFFVTSTLLGRVGRKQKHATKREFSKSDRRDAWQVLANGGVSTAAALVTTWDASIVWSAAFLGALATANGDTWATELGTLSRREPISLLQMRRVPRGTSGAVSPLGMMATLAGGCAVGTVAALLRWDPRVSVGVTMMAAAASGVVGSLADSVLGATVQARFHCPRCRCDTEGAQHHCGTITTHVGGWRSFGNDHVNAVATLLGGFVGVACCLALG